MYSEVSALNRQQALLREATGVIKVTNSAGMCLSPILFYCSRNMLLVTPGTQKHRDCAYLRRIGYMVGCDSLYPRFVAFQATMAGCAWIGLDYDLLQEQLKKAAHTGDRFVYAPSVAIGIDVEANRRFAELSWREINSQYGYRVLGGDVGDLCFEGFEVQKGKTELVRPRLFTLIDYYDEDEVNEQAQNILDRAYESVGLEAFY